MLNDAGLDLIFRKAKTYGVWTDKPVTDETLKAIYDVAKWGPTSANCCPLRILFIRSQEAKERLKPILSAGNVDKTMKAPVTAVFCYDLNFPDKLDQLYPQTNAKALFEDPDARQRAAFLNSTLQAAYFMIAARALGLDCGPISGFNNEALDKTFFIDTAYKALFICNLAYADYTSVRVRNPRPAFEEIAKII